MSECKEPRPTPIVLRNEQSQTEKCGFEARVGPEADREVTVTRIQKAVTVVEVEAAAVMLTHDGVTTLDVLSMEDFEKYFGVCRTAQTVFIFNWCDCTYHSLSSRFSAGAARTPNHWATFQPLSESPSFLRDYHHPCLKVRTSTLSILLRPLV